MAYRLLYESQKPNELLFPLKVTQKSNLMMQLAILYTTSY